VSREDAGLLVSGGVGGVAVNLEELGCLAAALEAAGERLQAAGARLDGARAVLALGGGLAPDTAEAAERALARAHARLAAVAGGTFALAAAVRRAREAYAAGESRVRDALVAVATGGPGAVDPLRAGVPLPGVPRPLAQPDHAVLPLAVAVSAVPGAGTGVRVAKSPTRPASGRPPAGVGDLMRGIDALYPASGGPAGAVGVRLVEAANGARSWVVLVPGTQTLAVGGRNPFDDATNLQAYAGLPTAAGAAVLVALGRAGARPDEPVLLAGHSQGGMTAMRLAASPAVRRRFRIGAVVTAGSPVDRMPTPPGVAVLHLEHSGDPVHVLDGGRTPDGAARTTVRRRSALGGAAHDVRSYAETGDLVDASAHPSLVGWRERAAPMLGGPGATAHAAVYVAERVP
jgi:hypothetical protein